MSGAMSLVRLGSAIMKSVFKLKFVGKSRALLYIFKFQFVQIFNSATLHPITQLNIPRFFNQLSHFIFGVAGKLQYAPHSVLSKLNYSSAEENVYIIVLQCGMNDSVHFHVCSCMDIFLSVCDSRS